MTLELIPLEGIGEIVEGARLGRLLVDTGVQLIDGDVIVVSSKAVAKAEGRVVDLDAGQDAWERLIVSESRRVLRRRGALLITETKHGFVCANAGIDRSNVQPGKAVLLPADPDRSAHVLRNEVRAFAGVDVGVIVSDTNGRTWREGVTDVAIGCAGLKPLLDLRNQQDGYGNRLEVTQVCVVDELAAAASIVIGKTAQVPLAIARGASPDIFGDGSVRKDLVRNYAQDMFR